MSMYGKNHYNKKTKKTNYVKQNKELGRNVTTRKAQISEDKISNIITVLLNLLGVDGPQTLKDKVILNLIVHVNYLKSM